MLKSEPRVKILMKSLTRPRNENRIPRHEVRLSR